jgi:hypothetical protein
MMPGSLKVGGYRIGIGRAKAALPFFCCLKQKKPLAGIPGALMTVPLISGTVNRQISQ